MAVLRGKATRQQPPHVAPPLVSPVPPAILLTHQRIQLCVDICFINNLSFLVSISRFLKLKTVDQVSDVSDTSVLPSLHQVLNIYSSRGFIVNYIHADNDFRGLADQLLSTRLNLTSAGEHVPDIERFVRTLKERCRTSCHSLPYGRHPKQLTTAIVRHNNTCLNWEIAKDRVSDCLSPRTIVWGDSPDFQTHSRLKIGAYCKVFEPRQITNTQAARTIKALTLHPAGNTQGGHRFLSINTGKIVSRNQWVSLPIPDDFINEVEALAKKQDQLQRRYDRIHFHFLQMERTIELAVMNTEEIASLMQTEIMLTQMSAKKQ